MSTPTAALSLTTTAAPTEFSTVGQIINFIYAVSNVGNVAIDGPITITDDLVTNETCPALATVGNGDDRLDVGETIPCTSSYTINAQDLATGSVTSTATASGTNGGVPVDSGQATATAVVPLLATFAPGPSSGDPRISMEAGTPAGAEFEIEIHGNAIVDLYGAAFSVLYAPAAAEYLGCEATDSILATGAISNPCNGLVVGGAKFQAELQNGQPGILNVVATKDGLVGGVDPGTGLLVTLRFRALMPIVDEPIDFEPTLEIVTCPSDLSACSMPSLPWDGGTFTAVQN